MRAVTRRRVLWGGVCGAVLALLAGSRAGIAVVDGWVLRADDLRRR